MARGGKLKAALDNFKGVNHNIERQKKLAKQASRRKRTAAEQQNENEKFEIGEIDDTDSSEDEDDHQEDKEQGSEGAAILNGVSLKPIAANSREDGNKKKDEEENDNDDDEDDIPYSDIASLNSEDRGDAVPFQRLTINNHSALTASLNRIALPFSTMPFSHHQCLTASTPSQIKDIDDDLARELVFYAQALASAKEARKLLKAEGVSFSRPPDFFAEMVKSEEHMGRIRQKLVDDAAQKKASSEAKRQRDLKKYAKAVQVAKAQERDKARRETMDKINILKRSMSRHQSISSSEHLFPERSNVLPTTDKEEDMFDVSLEQETKKPLSSNRSAASLNGKSDRGGKSATKRQKKDEKYGFGGKKRFAKSGDAASSSDMRDFSMKRMKGKDTARAKTKTRPGKARRAKARS